MSRQSSYLGLFLQDDIRLTPKLTLNLGLRFEVGFDEKARLPVTVAGMDLKGGLLFVNKDGRGRRQGNLDANNFGPRVGFAWQVWCAVGRDAILRGGCQPPPPAADCQAAPQHRSGLSTK